MKVIDIVKNDIVKEMSGRLSYPFLSGFIRGAGTLSLKRDGFALTITHESAPLIECVVNMILKTGAKNEFEIYLQELPWTQRLVVVNMSVVESAKLLGAARIVNGFEIIDRVDEQLFDGENDEVDYIKGIFAASGKVYIPDDAKKKQGYHLEIALSSETVASGLVGLLSRLSMKASVVMRQRGVSVYIKDKEMISNFLAAMGSSTAVLRLQEIILEREVRNNANRNANCSVANVDKTVKAGGEMVLAIRLIDKKMGLDKLPIQLRQTAEARLQYPELSLSELLTVMPNPPTKSGLQHRLNKLKIIAEKLNGGTL